MENSDISSCLAPVMDFNQSDIVFEETDSDKLGPNCFKVEIFRYFHHN